MARYDARNHRLVPKHEKMDEEEVEKLLEEYKISKEDLPKIERTDAPLKSMDIEVGDVIKITRESPTAGESEYYRVVVES